MKQKDLYVVNQGGFSEVRYALPPSRQVLLTFLSVEGWLLCNSFIGRHSVGFIGIGRRPGNGRSRDGIVWTLQVVLSLVDQSWPPLSYFHAFKCSFLTILCDVVGIGDTTTERVFWMTADLVGTRKTVFISKQLLKPLQTNWLKSLLVVVLLKLLSKWVFMK